MRPLPLSSLLTAVLVSTALAETMYLDPADAGPDFGTQGEYIGDNCAAQVIALGDGKFHIVGWSPSLPGVNAETEKKVEVDAHREGEKVVFDGDGWKGAIEGIILKGTNSEGRAWDLKKTNRQSPTLGAKPPAGAVVLFDGTNADAWKNGKVDHGLLAGGTVSKQAFGDSTIHVEFRTPFMPNSRGQARGNSGVYVQNRYECQVLDSFGLKGEINELGAVYSKLKPSLNMCFPPLSWQTYDIDLQAATFDAEGKKTHNAVITLRLNGVVVLDHKEIEGPTPGGQKENAEPGPIQLQNHGDPVFFQNIWVVEKK